MKSVIAADQLAEMLGLDYQTPDSAPIKDKKERINA